MNILKNIAWFAANLLWNGFLTLGVMLVVYACISYNVPGEAAAIGLVDVSDAPLWVALVVSSLVTWSISATVGWAALLAHFPWEFFFIAWLINN